MTTLTRRGLLGAAAALPLIATARPVLAKAEMKGASMVPYNRIKLGGFEVTTLLAGTRTVPDLQTIFGMNVSADEFAAAAASAMIPADKAQFFFTPTLVNTGNEVVLFDTGLNGAGITAALTAAGHTADQVDVVVITHMHGDHIGGLMTDGKPTFANARYVTGAAEFNHWSGQTNEGFDKNVRPMADKFTMVDGGASPVAGLTATPAFGHTPGHMAWRVESNGASLIIGADFANHYIFSLQNPDWEVKFDADKAAAAATRRNLLSMIADEKIPFIGYHMPFPALGFVEAKDGGFRHIPATYQFMMEG